MKLMNRSPGIIMLLSLLLNCPEELDSQHLGFSGELPGVPKFYFDAIGRRSEDIGVSRLDIFIEVPNEALQFYKSDDVFRSVYEISVNIYDSAETLVEEEWWTEKSETADYARTVSTGAGALSQRSFELKPGKYFAEVQLKDNETQKISRVKRKIEIKDYSAQEFGTSDIILANKISTDSGKTEIYPNIRGNVGSRPKGFYYYYEAYSNSVYDSADVTVTVRNVKGDTVKKESYVQALGAKKNSCFHFLSSEELVPGDYIMELVSAPKTSGRVAAAISSRPFIVRTAGLPVSVTDLDQAIEQLQYITTRDELEAMRKAPREQKLGMFRDFWKKKDSTPGTERNELMDEYYSRVQYADKHFGHYLEGWKTDMGMIYIIFGSPSSIERHPFEIDSKPYEIWTYYELNREFVFVDLSGFGDYRLQSPAWDLPRTRSR